ncbi:helix-turn-helix transcriptional regulator [Marinibacterium profundimaris]|uniref:Transcriptional regulator n=1 Tax=Marinibacterium profundimaris TaxID=1679460 RepID=A0A225NNI0_9RHOB|nr:YafY family protein [Marinibacterium profundimaris]OWU76041.1 transcriptional regulator [Marinibacterium profundimaris]
MTKSTRMFELIQILRAARRPVTADELAERLGVSARTVYRDIAALQAMRTPIEGEAGLGYVMRRGYDLPPLNFDQEELEALRVGLALLVRTGDSALVDAAGRIGKKIDALQEPVDWLKIALPGVPLDDPEKGCVSKGMLRAAIREERKIEITYRDEAGVETQRILRPVAMLYYHDCAVLAAWCELRRGFRCFRTDRIWACTLREDGFAGEGPALRRLWEDSDTPLVPFATAI